MTQSRDEHHLLDESDAHGQYQFMKSASSFIASAACGVDLCGGNLFMTEHLAYGVDVCTIGKL